MGHYLNEGKQVLHTEAPKGVEVSATQVTHIADAGDSEKAHFLTVAANAVHAINDVAAIQARPENAHYDDYMRGMANGLILAQSIVNNDEPKYVEADKIARFDYVAEATLTLSNQFHGDMVAKFRFNRALDDSIGALRSLDLIKKTLFYGKDNSLAGYYGNSPSYAPESCALLANGLALESNLLVSDAENFIHGIIGLATEAGELLELLRDTLNGKPLDKPNLKEEVGDGKWYMAILAKVGGFMWGDDEKVNIAKLRKRFPDRFTEHDANNRNLAAERVILEGDGENQLPLNIE